MRAFALLGIVVVLATGCAAATYPPDSRVLHDAELVARIKTALLNAPGVDATKIDVRAADGAVTLLGSVARGDDLQAVVDLVSQLPGVVDVESKVAVRPRPEARAAAGGRRR